MFDTIPASIECRSVLDRHGYASYRGPHDSDDVLRHAPDRPDDHRRRPRPRNGHRNPWLRPRRGPGLDPRTDTAAPATSMPPVPRPPRRSAPTAPPPPSSAPGSSRRSPPTSRRSPRRWSPGPSPNPACPRPASPVRSAARPVSYACSPRCSARAAGPVPGSTRRCPTARPAASRHPAALHPARPGRRVQRIELPARVLGRRRRHRLRAGRRLPVVVKGHDAHPGTSELVARAITDAVATAGMPAGTFSLLFGYGPELGVTLVTDPASRPSVSPDHVPVEWLSLPPPPPGPSLSPSTPR